MHLLFKLSRLPRYGPPFEHLNADPRTRFNTTLVPDPELQQASYEACRRGEVPEHPPVGMQIPTVMDPSLAPDGFHIATTYGFFFPCEAPQEERGKLRDEMAERILDRSQRVPARPARLHRRARRLLVGPLRRDAGRHQRRLHPRPHPSRADDRRAPAGPGLGARDADSAISICAARPATPDRA